MIKVKVKNLKKYFYSGIFRKKVIKAVDNITFKIKEGETLGLVGESGSGKTTLGKTILRLIEPTSGEIFFNDIDVRKLKGNELKDMRKKMQIIFQNPESALNPRIRIYNSLKEPLRIHKICDKTNEREIIFELIDTVNLDKEILNRYPHELSGGQIQRVVLARVLTLNPEFIIADEPTSMLDVSVQAQILNLMKRLQREFKLTYLFISHDLDVVRWMSDEIVEIDNGRIVKKIKVS